MPEKKYHERMYIAKVKTVAFEVVWGYDATTIAAQRDGSNRS